MKAVLSLCTLVLACGMCLAESTLLFENSDFEAGSLKNWTARGDAMSDQPTKGDQRAARKRGSNNVQGDYWVGTLERYDGKVGKPGATRGDGPKGRLVSASFTMSKPYITFRIAGGSDINLLGVGLIVDGQELLGTASPDFNEEMRPVSFDVRALRGKSAKIVVVDNSDARRGFISADDFRAADAPQGTVIRPIKRPKLTDEWSTFPLYKRVGYDQSLRPQFHFTSRMGWLNDPNGMVYYAGEWHMLFQHCAKGNATGVKSWGNAVSDDLMHWRQLPHAIDPYPNVKWDKGNLHAIWSGSAVVDEINALGKQEGSVKTLYAIYTATHRGADGKAGFFQGAAYSTDKGRTWAKINGGKPIIDHQPDGTGGQRDPRIFYYAPGKYFVVIMMIGGKDRAVRLWKSTDLMNWEILGDVPNKAAECIDMYTVPLDDDKSRMKWVIADAGTRYEVGDFDGKTWKGSGQKGPDGRTPLRFDYGDAYYAAQAFNQGPAGRVVHVGWLRSKQVGYRPFLKAGMPFTQQMSIPAEITLRTTADGIRMYRNPVKEIEALYAKTDTFRDLTAKALNAKLTSVRPELIDLTLTVAPKGSFTFSVRGSDITYDAAKKEFQFTNTARVTGEKAGVLTRPKAKQRPYRDTGFRAIPAPTVGGVVKLRVLVDRASLELFVNDGQAAASFVVVPRGRTIAITSNDEMTVKSLVVNTVKSVWGNPPSVAAPAAKAKPPPANAQRRADLH